MSQVKLFTTPTLQNITIESYLGLATATQVAGTGFFTDFAASFSDFFGGNSGAYRKSMNRLFDDVVSQIKEKAIRMGGNAIIGVSVDYDNISAKAMSMFMISIQGTVVKIKEDINNQDASTEFVTNEYLNRCLTIKTVNYYLENHVPISDEIWATIISKKITELAAPLFKKYTQIYVGYGSDLPTYECYRTRFEQYATLLDYNTAVSIFYSTKDVPNKLIINLKLFSAKHILEIAKSGDIDKAIQLLSAEKSSYSRDDLSDMIELAEYFRNLPDRGKIEEISGVFGSKSKKYICICGNKNDADVETCSSCTRNIKGLTIDQVKDLNRYFKVVDTLSEIFNSQNAQ